MKKEKLSKKKKKERKKKERKKERMKKEEGLVILPVDKGNSTVVMDIDQYTSRMKELLDQDNYEIIKRNPTDTLVTSIK